MAVYVNTNYSALQGQRYLGNVQNSLTTTYQRLSSGMRINSAKDDAAGLQIADRLTSQINGLNQGNRNASDGIALAQTIESGMDEISGMLQKMRTLAVQSANGTNTRLTSQINGLNQGNRNASDGIALAQTIESGMDEISGMLQKMRTLAVQSANGTNTTEDRTALAKEMEALGTEINRISTQTTFAGKSVLNGQFKGSIYGDPNGQAQNKLAGDKGSLTLQVGSNKGDTITFEVESVYFSKIAADTALVGNDKFFKNDGGTIKIDLTKVTFGPAAGNNKTIGDVIDLMDAADTALVGNDKFFKNDGGTIKIDLTKVTFGPAAGNNKTIGDVIDLMDKAIAKVDGMRAGLGALQNRLESSIRNQSNVAANEADARSRIRDADFAEESANLSQQSIIQQAAASMLMQANTRPQLGLSLLG